MPSARSRRNQLVRSLQGRSSMFSPALRNRQKRLAAQSGSPAPKAKAVPAEPAADTAQGQEYAALRVKLHDDLRKLSDVQSHEARVPMKQEMARDFAPWIEGVLAAGEDGKASQDEILVTNMIWAVDYRDFDYALRIGAHVIRFGLALPERYSRTPACFLVEQIAETEVKEPGSATAEQLLALQSLTEQSDMPDQVRAKLFKALGRSFAARHDAFDPSSDNAPAGGKAAYASAALGWFQRALKLDDKAGVKKDIENMERRLKAATGQEPGQ